MDDKRLERIEKKIDDLSDHLSTIDITLVEQHISLKDHIKRTHMLEKEILPVKKHVDRVQGVIIFLGILASIFGLIEAAKVLFK